MSYLVFLYLSFLPFVFGDFIFTASLDSSSTLLVKLFSHTLLDNTLNTCTQFGDLTSLDGETLAIPCSPSTEVEFTQEDLGSNETLITVEFLSEDISNFVSFSFSSEFLTTFDLDFEEELETSLINEAIFLEKVDFRSFYIELENPVIFQNEFLIVACSDLLSFFDVEFETSHNCQLNSICEADNGFIITLSEDFIDQNSDFELELQTVEFIDGNVLEAEGRQVIRSASSIITLIEATLQSFSQILLTFDEEVSTGFQETFLCSEIIQEGGLGNATLCSFSTVSRRRLQDSTTSLLLNILDGNLFSAPTIVVDSSSELFFLAEDTRFLQAGEASINVIISSELISLELTDDLDFILTFSLETNQNDLNEFRCQDEIFLTTESNVNTILTDETCVGFWTSSTTLEISLTSFFPSAFLFGSSTITFGLSSTTSITALDGGVAIGTVETDFNPDELFPSFKISGPSTVTLCDDEVTYSVTQSSGLALNFSYLFNVFGETEETLIPFFNSEIDENSPSEVSVVIFDSISGDEFETLEVAVTRLEEESIQFSVDGVENSIISKPIDEEFTLNAIFNQVLDSCVIEADFQWIVLIGSERVIKTGKSVTFGAFTFEQGSQTVVVVSQEVSLTFELIITANEPKAFIESGSAFSVLAEEAFLLSARTSCNQELIGSPCTETGFANVETLDDLLPLDIGTVNSTIDQEDLLETLGLGTGVAIVRWLKDGDEIQGSVGNVVISETISIGATYTFQILDENGDIIDSASVEVSVLAVEFDCVLPTISLTPMTERINPTEPMIISTEIIFPSSSESDETPFITSYTWSVISSDVNFELDSSVSLTKQDLFIGAGILTEGLTFTFQLEVALTCALTEEITIVSSITAPQVSVNRVPFGGSTNVDPTTGEAVFEIFTLTASSFTDFEGDFPLEFRFEVVSIPASEIGTDRVFEERETTAISDFSESTFIKTFLPLPEIDEVLVILSVAKDQLGATSTRSLSDGFVISELTNPFLIGTEINEERLDASLIQGELDVFTASQDFRGIHDFSSATTGALNQATDQGGNVEELLSQLTAVREVCLDESIVAMESFEFIGFDTSDTIANNFKLISTKVEQISEVKRGSVNEASSFVLNGLESNLNLKPEISFPSSIQDSIVGTSSNLLKALNLEEVSSGRRLASELSCELVEQSRDNVERMSFIQNSIVVPGAPDMEVSSDLINLKARRQDLDDLDGLQEMIVSESLTGAVFPSAFLDGFKVQTEDDINVLVVDYDVDVSCERTDAVEVDCALTLDFNLTSPLSEAITSVLALDFFTFNVTNSTLSTKLTAENLTEDVELILKQPSSISIDCSSAESCFGFELLSETVCGIFESDETTWAFNERGVQCSAGEANDESGTISCFCNHASDYTAWNSFTRFATSSPEPLSEDAEFIIITVIPIFLLAFLLLYLWADRKDKSDAEKVTKGALARIMLHKLMIKKEKTLFFDNFKVAEDKKENEILCEPTGEWASQKRKQKRNLKKEFMLAIKYEHSVLSMGRYNPNFARSQKVAVFFAVVIGNFGTAALFYSFRTFDVSFWVSVTAAIASAVVVSLTVKLMIRAVFKATENQVASKDDLASCMSKFVARYERADGKLSEADWVLIRKVHDYFFFQNCLTQLEKDKLLPLELQRRLERRTKILNQFQPKEDPKAEAQIVEETEVDPQQQIFSLEELQGENRQQLIRASSKVREQWREQRNNSSSTLALYTDTAEKHRLVAKQKRNWVKLLAIVEDENNSTVRPRQPFFQPWVIYFNWFVLFLLCVGFLYFIYLFVVTRENQIDDINDNPQCLSEDEMFRGWMRDALLGLLISYVIAEPILLYLRYIFLPQLLSKFKVEKSEENLQMLNLQVADIVEDPEENHRDPLSAFRNRGQEPHQNTRSRTAIFADIVENVF